MVCVSVMLDNKLETAKEILQHIFAALPVPRPSSNLIVLYTLNAE